MISPLQWVANHDGCGRLTVAEAYCLRPGCAYSEVHTAEDLRRLCAEGRRR